CGRGTGRTGGFTDAHVAGVEAVLAALAGVTAIRVLRRQAINLLDAYVGHHAGARILKGQIRVGHTETINAAIWLSDMRGFTAAADRLDAKMLLDLLNRYFGCQVPAILEAGGGGAQINGER